MSTIGERRRLLRESQTVTNHNDTEELALNVYNIETSPSDSFRDAQTQENDDDIKIQELFDSRLLNDSSINGNDRKIWNNYKGDNVETSELKNKLEPNGTDHYVEKLLSKYPHRTSIKSFGNMTLKTIFYTFNPDTIQEAAYIINEIREGFRLLWCDYISKRISIWKLRVKNIREILKKNGISVTNANNRKLGVAALKKILFSRYDIDMSVLNVEPPQGQRTSRENANNNNSVNEVQEIQQQQQPQPLPNRTVNDVTEEDLINNLKKDQEKLRKVLRSEMMQKIKQAKNIVIVLNQLLLQLQNQLDESDFVEACDFVCVLDKFRQNYEMLAQIQEREIVLYKAAPRRKKSRYVGRAEFINDLDKRIKQYANEKKELVKRLYEVACQTRSHMMLACASGPCYGLTELSQATLWISPVMQLCSMGHCIKIKGIWDDFLQNRYALQRADLQENYQFLTLQNKLKQLVNVAKQNQIAVILDKCKDLNLGYLLSEIDEQGIELNIEESEDDDDDDDQEMD